ncbi:MAG: GHMP kinase [Chloroflexi bacterium]|nr:GHMP kinase [Chloroflexota bacterium]
MLIARAPVRISLAGGGTDLPAYYEQHGGLVVSTSIDKYFYIFVSLNDTDSVQISSSDYHAYFRQRRGEPWQWDGDLSLPRAFLHEFGIDAGISLFLASEVPPGTGLGSSSAVSVALAKALSALSRRAMGKGELAELASFVEIDKLGMPIGRQDQYAAAFGGLNMIRFGRQGVRVEPLNLPRVTVQSLERRLLLFFTGSSREAASILAHQQASTRKQDAATLESLHRIKAMAETTIALLRAGELDQYGALLHESWETKKRLARGITNAQIDEWYDVARAHGAVGGKLTGAGGGGFLMLYCAEHAQDAVTAALEQRGLVRMDFRFDDGGAVVLMDSLPHVSHLFRPMTALAGTP